MTKLKKAIKNLLKAKSSSVVLDAPRNGRSAQRSSFGADSVKSSSLAAKKTALPKKTTTNTAAKKALKKKKIEKVMPKKMAAASPLKDKKSKVLSKKTEKVAKAAPKMGVSKAPTGKMTAQAKKPAVTTDKKANSIVVKKAETKPVAKVEKPTKPVETAKIEVKAKKPKEIEVTEIIEETIEVSITVESEAEAPEEVVLTDAEGRRYCRVKECDQFSAVEGYCRFHYLKNWKKIQIRKKILTEGKLDRYIEELTARYPDKYLELLRKDLRNEKDFMAAIQELEIDDSAVDNEYEDEAQSFIEEVRGMSGEASSREEEEY